MKFEIKKLKIFSLLKIRFQLQQEILSQNMHIPFTALATVYAGKFTRYKTGDKRNIWLGF
jgi:hypothetical protein